MGQRILGIVGSYRKGGTIDAAVSEVLAAASAGGAETEKIYLLETPIEFCTNCRRCTQGEGSRPGRCILDDGMAAVIDAIENADALVLGAPVNVGSVNALTQRFLERLLCYTFWPWGRPAPKLRKAGQRRKPAVLVTSSAMPGFMGRLRTGALRSLKKGAETVGARSLATLYVGLAAGRERQPLPPGIIQRARRAGRRLAEKTSAPLGRP